MYLTSKKFFGPICTFFITLLLPSLLVAAMTLGLLVLTEDEHLSERKKLNSLHKFGIHLILTRKRMVFINTPFIAISWM